MSTNLRIALIEGALSEDLVYNAVWHAAALGKYFCRFLVEKWADDVMPCVPRDKSL